MPEKFSLRVTQASLNQTALDWPRNMANIYSAIDEAVFQGSDILALEELTLTGYEVNDDFQRTDNTRILAALQDVAAYAKAFDPSLIISIGHPWRLQMRNFPARPGMEFERAKDPFYDRLNLPFNVQSIISGGEIHGMAAKSNLYNDGRGYEKRYFNEWSMEAANRIGGTYGTIKIPLGNTGKTIPFGMPILHVSDRIHAFNLASPICEMKWVATRYDGHPHNDSRYETDNIIPSISRYLGSRDGLVLAIPNASPPERDKMDKHVHLNTLASRYADLVIDTDGLGTSGSTFAQYGHRMVAQDGKILSYGSRMRFSRVATTTSTVQISAAPAATAAKAHASLSHSFKNKDEKLDVSLAYKTDPKHIWDAPDNENRHYEEVIRYTAFWLFDYMRKNGTRGIMEALSGGADSAFNSVMVSVMVHMGMEDMGVESFCNEMNMPYRHEVLEAGKTGGKEAAAQACLKHMLTGVYMGTNNNSDATLNAARFLIEGGVDAATGEIVKGIGGKFVNRNVQDLLDFYGTMYAVENTGDMDPLEKFNMMRDIANFLNSSSHASTKEERAQKAAALKTRYPKIEGLINAADDVVTYENIQARGREVLIMLFANKEGKMAVANPNLDEARNAYATFGGDLHSGTINLNMHMPKSYELAVMLYLYKHGVQGVMPPVRALGPILRNKPSAQLQPKGPDGEVTQSDEDSLQRTFEQMHFISTCMLSKRTHTEDGDRRLNAGEVYEACRNSDIFANIDENRLYNMVKLSYVRWGIAQHKIHATPVGPTFGMNVDHQTSLRTPNISGQSRDELSALGLDLMFQWAAKDGIGWNETEKTILRRRTWQDETFNRTFDLHLWHGKNGMDYDLRRVYDRAIQKGLDDLFKPLSSRHPVRVVTAQP